MISTEIIEKYTSGITPNNKLRSEMIEKSNELKVHAKGIFPEVLVGKARPNEPLEILAYRKLVYEPKTKSAFGKIFNLLKKIPKAEDWKIEYNDPKGAIANGDTLQKYCEENFPKFDSITNYFFSVGLKKMLTDPNGVILVYAEPTGKENEYNKPKLKFFSTEQVVTFDDDLFVGFVKNKSGGKIYFFADNEQVIKATPTKKDEKIIYNQEIYNFNFKEMPCVAFGGDVEEIDNEGVIYQSFISDAVPAFNEAVRMYSDHQANMVMHSFPEKWVYTNQECSLCRGSGKVRNELGDLVDCKTLKNGCNGSGYMNNSPFGLHIINPASAQEQNAPIPNTGYIEKDLASIEYLAKDIDRQIRDGFSALGLEYLAEVGANQSGIAKEYDRSEINSFVFGVARHIVENIFKPVYYFVNEWRYEKTLSEQDRKNNIPQINVPQKFDTLTSSIISERLKNAVANNYDYQTIKSLQVAYAKKEFGENSLEWRVIKAVAELNPLPNLNEDEKMTILSNQGTTKINYIVSCNIIAFVQRAMNENSDFLYLEFLKQKKILAEYAKEIINENKAQLVPIAPTLPNG